MSEERPIAAIALGERHRKELGDIAALAASIKNVGLLHPIVIRPDNCLIAGERRLAACQQLGWTDVPVRVVDLDEIVRGEFAENADRKDFLPSEIEAIRRAMAPKVQQEATTRKLSGRSAPDKGETRDKIGAFANVSGRTVEKIAAVVEAAEREPKFAPLVAEMDRTGKVDGAYRKLRQANDEQAILSSRPGEGKFRTLVIDPPWDHEGLSLAGRGRPEYAVMSQNDLLALDVARWAETDCHLYLWATNNFLLRAGALIEKLRKARKWSMAKLAAEIEASTGYKTTAPTINKLEKDGMQLTQDWQDRIAKALGVHPVELYATDLEVVRVRGAVEAGVYKEPIEWPVDEQYPVQVPRRFEGLTLYGLEVRGPSMNLIYPAGTVLICASLYELEEDPIPGKRYIVERINGSEREATVKEFGVDETGKRWLWPRSTHPDHQRPIPIEGDPGEKIEITGRVLMRIQAED